jgi:hypothetical protein
VILGFGYTASMRVGRENAPGKVDSPPHTSRLPKFDLIVLGVICAARLGLSAWRAATQSITIDEAFTFNRYLHGPWSLIYGPYDDTNNHFLYTILAKLSISALGLSEFAMRLPSVLAGLILFTALMRLLALLVPGRDWGSRIVRWIAYATLALHPLLMDMTIAARGYGLALAFYFCAVLFTAQGRHLLAGILLGLSMAANLSLVFPVCALLITCILLSIREPSVMMRRIGALGLLPIALAAGICYPALASDRSDAFYLGLER